MESASRSVVPDKALQEPRGKFLYDMVSARLAAQASDISTVQGRAKDLLGVATITATITGAIANDRLFNLNKYNLGWGALTALVVGFVCVFGGAAYCLKPRTWYLSPAAVDVGAYVEQYPDQPVDHYYSEVAGGFLHGGQTGPGTPPALEQNDAQVGRLAVAVRVQMFGLLLLAVAGFFLAYQAVSHG